MVEELNQLGIAENTLLIFMSDNGGINRSNATSNAPLREGKAKLYECGVRVPFIAYWPGKIKPNTFCDLPIGIEDMFPTILNVVGQANDLDAMKLDGQSILPLLKDPKNGAKHYTRDTFFWHKAGGPRSAIRKGDYKLIYDDQGYLELYNIAQDIEEKNDLAERMPEKAQELFKQIDVMIDEVVPAKYQRRPNPLYDPEANANSKAPPYRNLRNLPVEKTNAKPAPKKVASAPAKPKESAALVPANQTFESRIWAKGKQQEMEGSLADIFVNPKGKTILTIKTVNGQTSMLGAKVLHADDLKYLKSVGARLPAK